MTVYEASKENERSTEQYFCDGKYECGFYFILARATHSSFFSKAKTTFSSSKKIQTKDPRCR
jgi:hypothetical protein